MDFVRSNFLTILIFLPSIGALFVLAAPGRRAIRHAALATTFITFIFSLFLLLAFDWTKSASDSARYAYASDSPFGVIQLVQRLDWIPAFHIQYLLGIDGLSLPIVLLSTFIFLLAAIASLNIEKMTKGYFALFLFLETGILGVFLSLDFFLFYVFFEVSLLPMYFLIGVWGGPRKEYAAIKFFLYTLVGSVALLIVLIGTYLYSGTFDLIALSSPAFHAHLNTIAGFSRAAPAFFILAMVGFLIKVPAVPFHTWLPDAHVEAPTPISMILAAILLKMGGYGIFRVAYPLFPESAKHFWLLFAIVGVVSILYGALCTLAQTDFKRLVAYSSVSHMGFVVLGAAMLTPAATSGAIFMMVSHGIISAAMFFIVGIIYDRAHHRQLSRLGGIANTMPIYTGFSTVAIFANLGLPGLCGFVGEILVILGAFQAARPGSILMTSTNATSTEIYVISILATIGIVLAAAYMLWTLQRIFFGPEKPEYKDFAEIDGRELAVLTPLTIMVILLGILPSVFIFGYTNQTVSALLKLF